MNFEQALADYLSERKPPASVETSARQFWPNFVRFCRAEGLAQLESVTGEHVQAFRQRLMWEPGPSGRFYSGHTVDVVLRLVRHVLRWAHHAGVLEADPSIGLVLPRVPQPTQQVLPWAELQAVLAVPDHSTSTGLRNAAAFWVMAEIGLLPSRCVVLNLADEPQLELQTSTRSLLTDYLQKVRPLWVRAPQQKALFLNRYGARLGIQTLIKGLEQCGKAAGASVPVTTRVLARSYRAELDRASQARHSFPLNRKDS
jgi:site-specific recombinase XerD